MMAFERALALIGDGELAGGGGASLRSPASADASPEARSIINDTAQRPFLGPTLGRIGQPSENSHPTWILTTVFVRS